MGVPENTASAVAALASRLNVAAASTTIAPAWLTEAGGSGGQCTPATHSINAPDGACASTAAKRIIPPPAAPRSGSAQSQGYRTSPMAFSRDVAAPMMISAAMGTDTAAVAPLGRSRRRGLQPPPLRCESLNASAQRSSSCPSSRSATAVGPPAAAAAAAAASSTPRTLKPAPEARGSSGSSGTSGGPVSGGRVSPLTGAPAAVSATHLPAGAIASTAEGQPPSLPHVSPALAFQPLGMWRSTAQGRAGDSSSARASASAVPMGATTLESPLASPPRAPATAPRTKTPNSAVAATSAAAAAPTTAPAAMGVSVSDVGTLLTYEIGDNAVVIVDADAVPDDLVCGVCMSVCRQPTATTCGHLFCRRCLQTWMRTSPETAMCPLDRTPLVAEQLHTDARAQRQINALRCRCPASLPRTAQLELRGMTLSESAVEPSQGATAGAAAGEQQCPWRGCISDAAAHLRQCPHLITPCPFSAHGCTAQLTRAQLAQHVKDDVAAHLLLVSQALIASATQCRLLQEEVDVLRRRCTMRGAHGSLPDADDEGDDRVDHDDDTAATTSSRHEAAVSVSLTSSHAGLAMPPAALANAAAPHARAMSLVLPAPTSNLTGAPGGTPLANLTSPAGRSTGAVMEDTSINSGSLPHVVSPFSQTHPSHLPVYHQPSPVPLGPPMSIATFPMRAVGPAMAGAPSGAAQRAGYGVSDFSHRADAVSPLRTPSPPQPAAASATAVVAVPSLPMNSPSVSVPPQLHMATSVPQPSRTLAMTPLNGGGGSHARGTDQFVWVIADVAELQAPCYSRVFTAHGLSWYVGIDTSPSWEQCGVYLFAEGHNRRVDFRVVLFHDDTSRDIAHMVRDWREDYIGKGWGPLRFINRFRLEQEGYLARGCLRVGIEVISDPY